MTTAARAPLTTRLSAGHWRHLDAIVGAAYAATLLGLAARDSIGPPFLAALGGALTLGLAIAWRRRNPLVALGFALAVLVVLRWPYQCLLPMWLALYQVAATSRRWIVVSAVMVAGLAPAAAVSTVDRTVLLG